MSWIIPQPADIADRASSIFEQIFPDCDARSTNSLFATTARITGQGVFDAYLYQARLAEELMVDTAIDWLSRHGSIWGVPQAQPAAATGTLLFSAPSGFDVPAGLILTAPSGVLVQTTAAVVAGGGNTASVPVVALVAGSAGNLAAAIVLTMVTPLVGLTAQTASVVADAQGNGLSGGLDLETTDSWRARILARIRNPPQGGAGPDYVAWVQSVVPDAIVSVQPNWVGPGTVGVIVAGPGPSAITPAEVTAIEAYIAGVRPVTAGVYVIAATLVPVAFTIALNPNTIANQTNGEAALLLWMAQDARVGGTLYMSRADNALSSASGEYSHERSAPLADLSFLPTQIPTLGAVTWAA
jgi:uncharacterized phage protein gp47/JayE